MKNYSKNASKQYHTQLGRGDVGRYVLLPGDPKRCAKIAAYLDNAVLIADSREYVTYTGTLEGEKVSVTSTGIGGPSAAIAMEELSLCGADTFLRVGTCGGMQPEIRSGDIVIATGAVRMGGTTKEYVPIEYPAVASYRITNALADAAEEMGFVCKEFHEHFAGSGMEEIQGKKNKGKKKENSKENNKEKNRKENAETIAVGDGSSETEDEKVKVCHIGVVQCKDSFFGQHEPEEMPICYELENKWRAWKRMGCLASEMESATIFIVAARLRARAGTCLLVMANQEREKLGLYNPVVHDTDQAIRIAVEALRKLILEDRRKMENQSRDSAEKTEDRRRTI